MDMLDGFVELQGYGKYCRMVCNMCKAMAVKLYLKQDHHKTSDLTSKQMHSSMYMSLLAGIKQKRSSPKDWGK